MKTPIHQIMQRIALSVLFKENIEEGWKIHKQDPDKFIETIKRPVKRLLDTTGKGDLLKTKEEISKAISKGTDNEMKFVTYLPGTRSESDRDFDIVPIKTRVPEEVMEPAY